MVKFLGVAILTLVLCVNVSAQTSVAPECANRLSGPRAVLFDFLSGYPVLIPFPVLLQSFGGSIFAGDGTTWAYPQGWQGFVLPRKGAVIFRQDNQAFYKHASEVIQLGTTIDQLFQAQVGRILATFNLDGNSVQRICSSDLSGAAGPLPRRLVSRYYDAGAYTFFITFQFIDAGSLQSVITKVAVGLTQEYDQLSTMAFIPMEWVQFPGGNGIQPECNDGKDNDQDTAADHPADQQCSDPQDPSESN